MIGIFDSGSGGLTVLRALRDLLPSVDVVYFGDIKHAPYGSRSRVELSDLTMHALTLLHTQGATSIISACNSVSASLAVSLFDAFSIEPAHLIEMVGPTVAYFRGSSARLLLCATPATVESGVYQAAFRMIGKDVECIAIPGLAGAIEFAAPEREREQLIADAFRSIDITASDALILACTHYPLARNAFRHVLGDSIHFFDPAIAVAQRAERQLWPREAGNGTTRFLISKESEHFRRLVEELFPESDYSIEVRE